MPFLKARLFEELTQLLVSGYYSKVFLIVHYL